MCLCVCFESIRNKFLNNMQRYRLVSFGYKVNLMKSNARLPYQYEKRKI